MKSLEADVQAFIELSVEDACDDVTVSRELAISRQALTPASSYNIDRQAKLVALSSRINRDDYPEIDKRFAEELSKVTHFASGTPFVRMPRFVMHVGPGLAQYCKPGAFPAEFTQTYRAMCEVMRDNAFRTSTQEVVDITHSEMIVAPEALRNESEAATELLKAYAQVQSHPFSVMTVVSFSQSFISGVLNAMVEVDMHHDVSLCVHHKDGSVTVHRMDKDGMLEDWPYGILHAEVDPDELHVLKHGPFNRT